MDLYKAMNDDTTPLWPIYQYVLEQPAQTPEQRELQLVVLRDVEKLASLENLYDHVAAQDYPELER